MTLADIIATLRACGIEPEDRPQPRPALDLEREARLAELFRQYDELRAEYDDDPWDKAARSEAARKLNLVREQLVLAGAI